MLYKLLGAKIAYVDSTWQRPGRVQLARYLAERVHHGKVGQANSPVAYWPDERAGHIGLVFGLRTMRNDIAQKGEP